MIKSNIKDYDFPKDLKAMTDDELELLSYQIRDFLIDNLSKTGGHIASNLGVVEIAIALHAYCDTPKDKIIWDVGHQSYVHKILTGRAKDFHTLRQHGGISGFPKKSESEFDSFDTGHSSTSVSLAAGFAKARDLQGEDYRVISVIGDGAMTGGLAYEGLNNLGELKSKAIIILNDNGMSIDNNIGGLSTHLGRIRVSEGYSQFKKKFSKTIKGVPRIGHPTYEMLAKIRDSIKYSLVDGVLFEQLGLTYIGPVDGHNISDIIEALRLADCSNKSVVLHLVTQKGKGYKNAEKNPSNFHGIGAFEKNTGLPMKNGSGPSYSSVFGRTLIDAAEKDDKIVAISAAMIDGTGLVEFSKKFPERVFDVGIAEGHAVTFAAGLASAGLHPVVAIYSTFLQRAYDNIMMDVCLQNLPVVFAIDRGGVVGQDGETHHGLFDISYLKNIPNLTLMTPRDGVELAAMLNYALALKKPVAIRYPRGTAVRIDMPYTPIDGRSHVLSRGRDIEIYALGSMFTRGIEVRRRLFNKGFDVGLINPRFISPMDCGSLMESAKRTKLIVSMEDGAVSGGFGESVAATLAEYRLSSDQNPIADVYSFGWPKKFIEHGLVDDLFDAYGLSAEAMAEQIEQIISYKNL